MLKFHGAISVFTVHLIEQKSSPPIFTVLTLMVQVYSGVYFSRIGALRIPTSESMQSSVRKISKTTGSFSRIRYLSADWHVYGAGESTGDLAHFYRKSARGTLDFRGIASTFAMFLHSMPDQVGHDEGSCQITTPITSNYLIVNHLDHLSQKIGSNSLIYRVITPNFNHCYRMIAKAKDTDIS